MVQPAQQKLLPTLEHGALAFMPKAQHFVALGDELPFASKRCKTVTPPTTVVPAAKQVAAGKQQRHQFGNALWQEYCDLLGRDVWGMATTAQERQQVLAALAKRGRWVTIYYGWRPNLPDEADNHLVELSLAGGAAGIVTHNIRDLGRGELVFDQLRVLTPAQCLEKWQ